MRTKIKRSLDYEERLEVRDEAVRELIDKKDRKIHVLQKDKG